MNISKRYYHFFRNEYMHLLSSAIDIREAGLDMRQLLGLFCSKAKRKAVNSCGATK